MSIDKDVANFMDSFIRTPEPDIDQEYYALEDQYKAVFGHTVPRAMLPDGIAMDSIKEAMRTCIHDGKDTLFELLGVQINDEFIY